MKLLDETGLQHLIDWVKEAFVGKESGKGLSQNDYTTAEKNKLAGIATGANAYKLPTGNASAIGGVKLSDATSSTSSTTGGIAATPKAVQAALTAAKAYTDAKGYLTEVPEEYVTNAELSSMQYATIANLQTKLDAAKVKLVAAEPTTSSTSGDADGTIYFVTEE